ncbi:hypothetical protein L3Q65_38140 [Amycolatopsis sp. FU40]|uniref:hypothetical protein n=1 Tax=Amycolatopsis sp. FU40 TaxID=2914159 RepID=UPI001F1620F4|nr:hypothetical protein [Amycolatopsis sp. FU40]UKD53667.1 hypothetical protein L3Q65_38140 [Amycolatopsis sp. FU40]
MTNAKEFDLYSILAVTHHVPATALQFRTILAHIVGLELDQMPGARISALAYGPECSRWLLEQHPRLRDIPNPPDFHGDEIAMDEWVSAQAEHLGSDCLRLPIEPLPPERRPQASLSDILDIIAHVRGSLDTVMVCNPGKPDFGLVMPTPDHKGLIMDPNITLDRLRELAATVVRSDDDATASYELANTFQNLDEWLMNGGFLPIDWLRQQ